MDHSVAPDLAKDESDEAKTAEQYIRSLEEMIRLMQADQQEINRLRDESRSIGARTDAVMAETSKILARIRKNG